MGLKDCLQLITKGKFRRLKEYFLTPISEFIYNWKEYDYLKKLIRNAKRTEIM